MRSSPYKKPSGFIALITIFLISATGLVIGLEMIFLGTGATQISLSKFQSSQAGFLADLCGEEALMKLKENPEYLGDEIIELEGGTCQILPVEQNVIKVQGHFQDHTKKIKIELLELAPKLLVKSWKEVGDF